MENQLLTMLWDGKKEVKRSWREGSRLLLSKSHLLRIQEKSTKIKDQEYWNQMIENRVVWRQKRGGKKMERERLAPSKSHSANVSKCQQLSKAFSCFTRAHIAIWQRRVATITISTTTKTATRTELERQQWQIKWDREHWRAITIAITPIMLAK